jgi:hypothetical protein
VPTSGIEVANASSLQALEQDVLSVVQAGGAGGLLIGNGGTGLGLPAGIGGVSAGMAAMLPLGSAAMSVEARSQAFAECHRGARTWRDVLRTGDITVSGRPALGPGISNLEPACARRRSEIQPNGGVTQELRSAHIGRIVAGPRATIRLARCDHPDVRAVPAHSA